MLSAKFNRQFKLVSIKKKIVLKIVFIELVPIFELKFYFRYYVLV